MKDLRVESRFKNQILWEQIETTFRAFVNDNRGLGSLAAEKIGVTNSVMHDYLCLRKNPWINGCAGRGHSKDSRWRDDALKIAEFFGMNPEELFPPTLYALKLPRSVARVYDSPEVLSLQEAGKLKLLPAVTTDPTDALMQTERREALHGVLETLTPREEGVIKMRFGLVEGREYTLEETAQHYGVTKERARQIEAKAMRKLRKPARERQLRPLLP